MMKKPIAEVHLFILLTLKGPPVDGTWHGRSEREFPGYC
jgi:hypothetical protein